MMLVDFIAQKKKSASKEHDCDSVTGGGGWETTEPGDFVDVTRYIGERDNENRLADLESKARPLWWRLDCQNVSWEQDGNFEKTFCLSFGVICPHSGSKSFGRL